MELLRNKNYRRYTPSLHQHLDHENQVHGEYKEGYYMGVELDDPEAEKRLYGPNVWPAPGSGCLCMGVDKHVINVRSMLQIAGFPLGMLNSALYSYLLPSLQLCSAEYRRVRFLVPREVAKSVGRLVALALDLDIHFFDKPEMLGEAIQTLGLLHYDGQVSDPANGVFGAGAHFDFGFITLLATDDVICKDKDAKPQIWEYVPRIKGSFIVNLGDMLERWSNSVFKSTLHRVIGNSQDRYSIAYFIEPSHDCLVECLPTCKSEKNPPKFPMILCQTYLRQRYYDTYADLNVYTEHNN